MKRYRIAFVSAFMTLTLAGAACAAESGGFLVMLGRDTTSVERYTRDGAKLVVDQVGRSPRVLARHFEYTMDKSGNLKSLSVVVANPTAPAGAPPLQKIDATCGQDSIIVYVRRDTSLQTLRIHAPSGTPVISLSSPWTVYESATMKLAASKSKSMMTPICFLGVQTLDSMTVRRLGADSMVIVNPEGEYHLRVDKSGRVISVTPIKGTAQFTVTNVPQLDLAAYTAQFAASERASGAMGQLSTRDTVRATVGNAQLWIDYGRPAKRGRLVYGGVVPFGDLWRTGANAATQFKTDRALKMGSTVVPAGFYTLWTIPQPGGWKLVINGETGQWGTEHKAAKDLYTLDMGVSALPDPVERFTISIASAEAGGTINLDWDTTRASIPFTVQP